MLFRFLNASFMNSSTVLIVGASVAGLACAAALQKCGIDYIIIEKEAQIATPWRNHYERLHLHTDKGLSSLPYKKWDNKTPLYPSRRQVIDYLENYRDEFDIQPHFNTEAISIQKQNESWITTTTINIHFNQNILSSQQVHLINQNCFIAQGLTPFRERSFTAVNTAQERSIKNKMCW